MPNNCSHFATIEANLIHCCSSKIPSELPRRKLPLASGKNRLPQKIFRLLSRVRRSRRRRRRRCLQIGHRIRQKSAIFNATIPPLSNVISLDDAFGRLQLYEMFSGFSSARLIFVILSMMKKCDLLHRRSVTYYEILKERRRSIVPKANNLINRNVGRHRFPDFFSVSIGRYLVKIDAQSAVCRRK